jgi:uncharacterized membrane protein
MTTSLYCTLFIFSSHILSEIVTIKDESQLHECSNKKCLFIICSEFIVAKISMLLSDRKTAFYSVALRPLCVLYIAPYILNNVDAFGTVHYESNDISTQYS